MTGVGRIADLARSWETSSGEDLGAPSPDCLKEGRRVFDRKHLPAAFLLGLSTKVKNNVLNWNL